jgi:hypothetical protein
VIYYLLKFSSTKAVVEGTTQLLSCYTIEDNAVSPKDPRKIFLSWSLGFVFGDKCLVHPTVPVLLTTLICCKEIL